MMLDETVCKEWKNPYGDKIGPDGENGFQRPVIQDQAVKLACKIAATGKVPGQILIGIYKGTHWILDGQLRCAAFRVATQGTLKINSAVADVKFEVFDTWAAMVDRYVAAQQCKPTAM